MAAVTALSATCAMTACKENTVIRADIVPIVDNIHVFGTDTLTVNTKSIFDDSLTTSVYVSGLDVYMGAGAITGDPFFGKTLESFYFQVRQPQASYTFDKTKYQIDSAVLVLPYSGFSWGDTSITAGTQTYTAYQITGDFSKDSVYYTNSPDRTIDPTPIGAVTVSLGNLVRSKYDSTTVLGVKRAPHIRIRLSDAVRDNLINNSGGDNYKDYPTFVSWFKGIYVTCNNTGNTIPYFRLTGGDIFSTAGILMYYHTIGAAVVDTLTVNYPFDPPNTAFYNKVTRDYTGSTAATYFASKAVSDNVIMIQNQPGAAADIHIPNVKNLPRCIVNKAELIITQVSAPLDGVFSASSRIYPSGVDTNGESYTIADRYPTSSVTALAYIDGNVRTANIGGLIFNQYVLNIPRELERAITERRKELRVRINGTQTFAGAYRFVAAGSNYSQPQSSIKFNIVYTKL